MVTVIIAAAGQGKRMARGTNKVFISLNNRPLITHTLDVFEACPDIDDIIVVVGKEDIQQMRSIIDTYRYRKIKDVVQGGTERQHSIANALKKIPADAQLVLIHDGARPLITEEVIHRVLLASQKTGAAIVAVPVKDTIKTVNIEGFVVETLDRTTLWAVQTPQAFNRDIIEQAYRLAEEEGFIATDDAGLVERTGIKIGLIMGDYNNLKVTTPEDLIVAEAIIRGRKQCE
jgi:2-C-methyl-D-erythritol 4-phosphate cytidylyltransferase